MLSQLDHRLFHLGNGVWTNRLLDAVMPVLTDLLKIRFVAWVVLPAVLGLWLFRGRRKAAYALCGLVLAVGLTDALSHRVLKPFFHRARPDPARMEVVLRTERHYGYSFPSNHAANSFAGAMFLGSVYPALRIPFFLVAAAVAYSRVYVGVHYPFDVAAGALFGLAVGWALACALRRFDSPASK